jgi:membrane protein DedA with SNARE-associated domain
MVSSPPGRDGTTAPGASRAASTHGRALWSALNPLVRCGYSRPEGGRPLLETLHEAITTLIGDYGYVAIFVLMVLESACIPIPSEVTMLFGGALASPGFAAPGHELDLVLVALVGTLGNLVGSWLAYGAGAAGGRPLVDRFGRYLLILPHEVDRAHVWFQRRGELTVFVSRLLPVIRTFISLPAGVARMPFWRFTVYTILGCLPWTFALAWLGYLLGENWEKVEAFLQPVAWAIVIALAIGLIWWVTRRYRKVRAAYAELDAARERAAE